MSDYDFIHQLDRLRARTWIIGNHGLAYNGQTPTIELDVPKFTKATHYPDGYAVPGVVLGKVTSSGRYGPYDPSASDGRQTARAFIFSPTPIPDGTPFVRASVLLAGFIDPANLPTGNGLDSAARTALHHCVFVDMA